MTVAVDVDWSDAIGVSRTTLTTHLWTAPPLRRGTALHDSAFQALSDLDADLARFLPWFSHPHISVPALRPPTDAETSWDFSALDPFVADFMSATNGRPVVANFATIPAWMFTTPVQVPDDPDEIVWDYEQGAQLRDPSCRQVADYFYRLASWYIAGGFTDELGRRHESGHSYRFAYWEVLCEPDMRGMSPQVYTELFDAVVARLAPLDPQMKFVGLDWESGEPNARYWALQLLLQHFGPGDTLVATRVGRPELPESRLHAQGFVTPGGARKLLLINKTGTAQQVCAGGTEETVPLDGYAVRVLER